MRDSRGRGPLREGLGAKRIIFLAAAVVVLLLINGYLFFIDSRTSFGEAMGSEALVAAPDKQPTLADHHSEIATPQKTFLPEGPMPVHDEMIRGTLRGHLGLYPALEARKVPPTDILALLKVLKKEMNFLKLRPEQSFEMRLSGEEPKRLQRFIYHLSPLKSIECVRTAKGSFDLQVHHNELVVKLVAAGGKINHSLHQAFLAIGEPLDIWYKMTRIFASEINWSTDVRRGDSFKFVVEKRFVASKPYNYGKILAVEYNGEKTGRIQAFHYRSLKGRQGYYTHEQRSIRRPLIKIPLDYKSISSRFNRRRLHPVLHRHRAHLGVDYSAPRGAPVYAAGDGVVVKAGRFGPSGNMVKIKHRSSLATVYLHLQRIARGIRRGCRVKQWQPIGYVGSTGLATGPHLHFGLQVNGRYVDPLTYSAPLGARLSKGERKRFQKLTLSLKEQLDAIEIDSE